MEKQFKTNIRCSACVEKVTPFLDDTVGKDQWKVDLSSPQRILTIESEVAESAVKESLQKAGYNAEGV